MFNVCPGCGDYTDAKEVIGAPLRAVCPKCKYEHEFSSLPLFVVTGASCSGKTTVALDLVKKAKNVVVLDQDILWDDKWNEPGNDPQIFRNTWLRMAKNIHQAGKSVVLFGSCIPEQYESCIERRYVSTVHYMALICQPEELERRLTARPGWRNSGSQETIKRMLDYNKWLSENASSTKPNMTLLDTTKITIDDAVTSIEEWIDERIRGTEP